MHRAARLLALAHKFQGCWSAAGVMSVAELARVSSARVTLSIDLLQLAPDKQARVLDGAALAPRAVHAIAPWPVWADQRLYFRRD